MSGVEGSGVTRGEIEDLLGTTDTETVLDIQSTGASVGELKEALTWFEDDEDACDAMHLSGNKRVCRVYDILQAERERSGNAW